MTAERVLVTGAGGFIGSNLVDDQLARGRKVTALDLHLDRLGHLEDNPDCELVTGDIRDMALLQQTIPGHDVVFHLASAHLEVGAPDSFFDEVNVDAVKNVVKISRDAGVGRLVHCSSVGVYGPLQSLPANEDTECAPDIPYEITKLAGERVVRETAGDLDYVIIRPSWVYGPRCPRTLKLFRAIGSGKFIKVGSAQTFRHPVYITDMLQGFELAAASDAAVGHTLIIGAADPVSLDDLIREVARAQDIDFKPVTVPMFVMLPVCFVAEKVFGAIGKEPPFSRRSLKFFTESSAFDISRARQTLGYDPEVSIADGLRMTRDYFVREGSLQ